MENRTLGNTGRAVSEMGLGCWQLGGDWGFVSEKTAFEILETAVEQGINFIDTADVYGGGRSESLVGKFIKERSESLFVATKAGRFGYPGPYSFEMIKGYVVDSLQRLDLEVLDLLQLHCLPTEVMREGEVFQWLRDLQREGLIKHFGASVESMEEATMVVGEEGLSSLQVIFNLFRQKPATTLFDRAKAQGVGVIVRLPLASGLLSGKFTKDTQFATDDHRHYNADGDQFNVGETFAGLPFVKGLELVEELGKSVPEGWSLSAFAQRWILDHDAVSTVITGASQPSQVLENASVSALPPLSQEMHVELRAFYQDRVQTHIRGVY